jgi:hypothetical protein
MLGDKKQRRKTATVKSQLKHLHGTGAAKCLTIQYFQCGKTAFLFVEKKLFFPNFFLSRLVQFNNIQKKYTSLID